MDMLLIMAAVLGVMYLLVWLPQKRRMDAQRKAVDAMEPGARIVLNTGMFGTIRAVGKQQMVVELAPGVEVTVLRQAALRVLGADEEEFEYSDSAATPIDVAAASEVPAEPTDSTFADGPLAADALTGDQVALAPAENSSEANFYGQEIPAAATDPAPEAGAVLLASDEQNPHGQALPKDEADRPQAN